MKCSLLMFVVATSLSCCMAAIPGFGSCPKVTVKKDFDPSKYVGEWYEAERYFVSFEVAIKCNRAHYSLNSNGTLTVVNQGINSWTGSASKATGLAIMTDPQEPGKLGVVFPGYNTTPEDYWVLDTDYENFSVVYSCSNYKFFNGKVVWILTRTNQPSSEVLNSAYKVIKDNGLSLTFLMKDNQSGCPKGY